ncbi:MAG: SDR family NAD(P)-dependent oxidoreductase [Ignavibacteriales bacterium]|nr:SDR family NAD(P)-dependent oxidoreductase [Ignavibacteriales bacterium]MCF8315244.1 SDR family NAD(P)-dependent oxidoreductase [Ignavibacteriales bacterium]MCF8436864.1 SDR family NAD(P)-dependent oxidoreductase [Ignavibacteriales bacterium]
MNSDNFFRGQNILITGASTGIGRALAENLAHKDNKLILVSRRVELFEEILRIRKDNVLVLKCDVSDRESVRSAYTEVQKFCEVPDISILNSGVGFHMTPDNYDSRLAEITMGTNFMGVIYWIEQLLPDLIKKGSGMIAGVSSLADANGFSGSGFYCASKAALSVYMQGLRTELKSRGIKVITIKPGFVKTPMTDKNNFEMPLIMSAEKAATIILEGIKKGKPIIQFPFPIVFATRLISLLPEKLYQFLAGLKKSD